MRLLLDTHVALWAVTGDDRLSRAAATMIADPANDAHVSLATLWEMAIKNATGRSNLGMGAARAAAEFAAAGFKQVAITFDHIKEVERLPALHGDPFDRLLVATALADTYRLVTHDRTLAAYGDHVMVV